MDNIYRYYLSNIVVVWKPPGICQSDFIMLLDLSGQAVSGWNFGSCYAELNFWTNILRGFDNFWHVFLQAISHWVCVCGVRHWVGQTRTLTWSDTRQVWPSSKTASLQSSKCLVYADFPSWRYLWEIFWQFTSCCYSITVMLSLWAVWFFGFCFSFFFRLSSVLFIPQIY